MVLPLSSQLLSCQLNCKILRRHQQTTIRCEKLRLQWPNIRFNKCYCCCHHFYRQQQFQKNREEPLNDSLVQPKAEIQQFMAEDHFQPEYFALPVQRKGRISDQTTKTVELGLLKSNGWTLPQFTQFTHSALRHSPGSSYSFSCICILLWDFLLPEHRCKQLCC